MNRREIETTEKNSETPSNSSKQVESQLHLVWRKFRRHKLAMIGISVLLIFYLVGVTFPGFFAPYGKFQKFDAVYHPPTRIHFFDSEGNFHIRPFVYGYTKTFDQETWQREYKVKYEEKYPIKFFVQGKPYEIFGLFETNIHFFGVASGGYIFLLGADDLGRDLFSRIIYSLRISLTIGFVGVFLSLIIGLVFGGISGYIGGTIDDIIQRLIEIIMGIPTIPLWMAFSAAIPQEWSAIKVYFIITVLLSILGWTGLARVVRSKFISLREEDFIMAAKSYGASNTRIIFFHLIPNFITYILVNLTLAIPGMIIGETTLSFLGLGLRPPVVSLGVLLQEAQTFQTVSLHPWLLTPGAAVVLVVLSYNFVGDGLRDAADPYSD